MPNPFAATAFAVALACLAADAPAAGLAPPSRKPEKGCVWKHLDDPAIGLAVWVQECDFGNRKIRFTLQAAGLSHVYSDSGDPEFVIEIHRLRDGESMADGMRRVWAAGTDATMQAHCVRKPYREGKLPAGVERYVFDADAVLAKQVAARTEPGDMPEPACGEHGVDVDSVSYFETRPADHAHAFLFVQAGQDDPLFDETSLHLSDPVAPAAAH